MQPGLSGVSVITEHQHLSIADTAAAMQQGRPAAMQQGAGSQQQVQMQANAAAGAPAAASPGKAQDAAGLQRLTAALTAVLSSGMASDFVEGLKPVLHDGKLAISTYIKLQQDPEPVFIGMFSSLPAAVAAQKQSAELVGQLPPDVARKLIAQQLAHTDPTAGPSQQCQGGAGAAPERWHSNTTSESTAVGAGNSPQAGDATPVNVKQEQQHSVAANPAAAAAAHSSHPAHQFAAQQQQQQQQDSRAHALAAAAAAASQGPAAPMSAGMAAGVAAPSPRQPAADDVLRMLLHKGLHALTVAQAGNQQHPGEQGSSMQDGLGQETEASLLAELFNTPVSTPGSGTGLASVLQQLPSPQQQLTQQQRQALVQQLGSTAQASPIDRRALLNQLLRESQQGAGMGGMGPVGQQGLLGGFSTSPAAAAAAAASRGMPNSTLPPLLPLSAGQGAGGTALDGDLGLALDGALNDAMLREMGPWAGSGMAMSAGMPAGRGMGMQMPYSQAPAASYSAGFPAGTGQMGMAGYQQQLQQGGAGFPGQSMLASSMGLGGGYGNSGSGSFGAGGYAGGYNMMQQQGSLDMQQLQHQQQLQQQLQQQQLQQQLQQQQQLGGFNMQQQHMGGLQGMQYGGGYAGNFDQTAGPAAAAAAAPAAAAAAAAAAGASDGGGDKRKRTQSDPRVNCVKSVQYRVSRFPSELHDLCIQHWERARCARVVCNEVQGVMSVQNGRCVVTFNQADQEVVKGVADYLRYAGEERIKKWRRHVRMVDFPRPGNRTGELMTAEEFLCIVGYQSEAGGGKRARTDLD